MGIFIIPACYTGSDYGITVQLASLPEKPLHMTIAVGEIIKDISRDESNPFYSLPVQFSGLKDGQLYQVQGHVSIDDTELVSSSLMSATMSQPVLRRAGVIHSGGVRETPPARPKAVM